MFAGNGKEERDAQRSVPAPRLAAGEKGERKAARGLGAWESRLAWESSTRSAPSASPDAPASFSGCHLHFMLMEMDRIDSRRLQD